MSVISKIFNIYATSITVKIRLVDKGCYVNESRGEAFIFYPNNKLTCVKIPYELRQQFSPYDQAMVSPAHFIVLID